ncbi:hypothetical protein PCASD_06826 [Puccinia coronata f. sp. avenae]|uniref:Uncharacterized protein n=1 Tax=Puccinia coronata f. sp. avenae TaxID=200324 RepID=A0A2N5UQC7_9BASI|nr:hypothetical protein PCASD_06826 [Puccinia coronata f. sp. avenae]
MAQSAKDESGEQGRDQGHQPVPILSSKFNLTSDSRAPEIEISTHYIDFVINGSRVPQLVTTTTDQSRPHPNPPVTLSAPYQRISSTIIPHRSVRYEIVEEPGGGGGKERPAKCWTDLGGLGFSQRRVEVGCQDSTSSLNEIWLYVFCLLRQHKQAPHATINHYATHPFYTLFFYFTHSFQTINTPSAILKRNPTSEICNESVNNENL